MIRIVSVIPASFRQGGTVETIKRIVSGQLATRGASVEVYGARAYRVGKSGLWLSWIHGGLGSEGMSR